jgi:hypothetical protein
MFLISKILNSRKSVNYNLSDLFSRAIFWDVNIEKLSPNKDKDLIIQRVLSRHMNRLENLENLEKLYSKSVIKSFAKNSSEINGNENIEFIASRYGLQPRAFKKYIPNLKQYA